MGCLIAAGNFAIKSFAAKRLLGQPPLKGANLNTIATSIELQGNNLNGFPHTRSRRGSQRATILLKLTIKRGCGYETPHHQHSAEGEVDEEAD